MFESLSKFTKILKFFLQNGKTKQKKTFLKRKMETITKSVRENKNEIVCCSRGKVIEICKWRLMSEEKKYKENL